MNATLLTGTRLLLVCASLLSACGGGGDSAPPADKVEQTIGSSGGALSHASGASVTIPAAALAANTSVAIETAPAGSGGALPGVAVGSAFWITPHGQSFAQPVTVSIPFDPAQVPAGAQVSLLKTSNGANGPWIAVAGASVSGNRISGQVGSFSGLVAALLPQITRQPQSLSLTPGQAASFDVTAIGFNPPFSYQWQRSNDGGMNFADIAGANNSSYTLASAQTGDGGAQFRVLINNVGGTVTSAAATLTVTAAVVAPTAFTTAPMNQSVTAPASATFSAVANGSSPAYQWQRLISGVWADILGATNASYTTPATTVAADNGAQFRVIASNPAGSVTSNVATLTVTAMPAIGTWQQLGGGLKNLAADNAAYAAVALDLSGNPVVAWTEHGGLGPSIGVHVKRWDGTAWLKLGGDLRNYRPASGFTLIGAPSIDVDPTSGQPVVTWTEEVNRVSDVLNTLDVYVKRWDGSAWQQLGGALNNVSGSAGFSSTKIRVTAIGTPIVAWWETPNYVAAKSWSGAAWINFGAPSFVTTIPTGAQDLSFTELAVDGSGNPFVVLGASGGPFAFAGSGNGWAILGGTTGIRTTPAAAQDWAAAADNLGRLTVLLTTRDANVTGVRVRRLENGAWVDLGPALYAANQVGLLVYNNGIAVPYNTSSPIATLTVQTSLGTTVSKLQSFRQWDGAAWQPIAPDLALECQLAVRSTAAIAAAATPVVACLRGPFPNEVVVYRLVP